LCAAKAHLKRAILGQEEALRLHALCRVLREVDLLQVVVAQALQRSLTKYSDLEREDDFFEVADAPDIQRKQQGPLWWVLASMRPQAWPKGDRQSPCRSC
jgi:hypothetical protein